MTPRFYWPIKPHLLTQGWGTLNPDVYSQFGFTRHNGLDHKLSVDKKFYAPFDYTVVRIGYQPAGGGNFVGLISEPIDFPAFDNITPDGVTVHFAAGTYRVLMDALHNESINVKEGTTGKTGDLICINDNTGFTTGPHCHTQWRRVLWDGKVITTVDTNDANNSFDPTIFFTGTYAQDYAMTVLLMSEEVSIWRKIVALLWNRLTLVNKLS